MNLKIEVHISLYFYTDIEIQMPQVDKLSKIIFKENWKGKLSIKIYLFVQ